MIFTLGFRIDAKSINDTQKMLKDLDGSEDPTIFNEWVNRVAHTAKQICSDPDCKRIKIIETDQGRLNFEIADKEAIDCVIQSIQRHLTVMPGTQQEIFNKLKTEFEIKRTEY
ncbi:MAG: hypothetical protein WCD28_12875 [Nitrososphaeraceae archaeon]